MRVKGRDGGVDKGCTGGGFCKCLCLFPTRVEGEASHVGGCLTYGDACIACCSTGHGGEHVCCRAVSVFFANLS